MNNFAYIPEEMRQYNNWICWQAVPDERSHSGVSKRPINARTGEFASSTDPATWCDFSTAVLASEKYSGIGFCFENSPYFGVDVDDVGEEIEKYLGGHLGIVSDFIHTLDSYTELSQSETGLHIICRGTLPPKGRRKGKIEMYESGRFFAMTGDVFDGRETVRDCTEQIKALHTKYIGGEHPTPKNDPPPPKSTAPAVSSASVDELLEKALSSEQGARFGALFSGDTSGYTSQSEAELAFCNMLAFWCGRDSSKMDEIYRKSGLFRPKWDERHGAKTYGEITLDKAIADCTEVYEPLPTFSVTFKSPEIKPFEGEDEHPGLHDTGNAQRFVRAFGDDVRYNYSAKKWMYYDGTVWRMDDKGGVNELADKVVERMKNEAAYFKNLDDEGGTDENLKAFKKHLKASYSHKFKANMLAESQHRLPVRSCDFDTNAYMLNTPGGVLDLKNCKLYPHSREPFYMNLTGTAMDLSRKDCPLWKKFLYEIFAGDEELIHFIQKAVGYSLSGSNSEQCMFFLYGTGRNGKSTFLEVVRTMLGTYAKNIQPETIMLKKIQSNANSDIARLKGARLVTCVEPEDGANLNEGLVKQLTGGDIITARFLYGEEFEFTPEFKIWMATNYKPKIKGTDDGIWRRIRLVPFTVQIPPSKVDRSLVHKLIEELPSILSWAVQGFKMWQDEGLEPPESVRNATAEYRHDSDTIGVFIEEECTVGDGLSVKSSTLYKGYEKWCEENGFYAYKGKKFGGEVGKRFECKHSNTGTIYLGLTYGGYINS